MSNIAAMWSRFSAVAACCVVASQCLAQPIPRSAYAGMEWRCIGPHRAGRTVGAGGDPQHPNVLYMGVNNGGVWKTTDYGRTWNPIFDEQPTGSIGCLTVAPSNGNVIYVGSGEGLQRPDLSVGDGVYKTVDGGKTWTNTGLSDAQQIVSIVIHPADPNKLLVSALGHPYGPNDERGVFRSMDGGKTWKKVLYKDPDTGAAALVMDPNNAAVLYASLWSSRQAPWENGWWQGPGTGLYKSVDFGLTWKPVMKGLPTFEQGLGRIGLDVARSNSNMVYATVDARENGGIYRSEDAGETWTNVCKDPRVWARGSDFAEIDVDVRDANTVYCSAIALYKSTDGAKTFTAIKGAPGGDDYHTLWQHPKNADVILLATDQGAVVSVNNGDTWSSWYNQPTAQFYHVSTDNAFPYNVYGGQQESGSVCIASRGKYGQISIRDWTPVGADEYAYVAADPLDANIIFGGRVSRYDKRTGVAVDCPPPGRHRVLRTAPLLFSTVDNKTLFYGAEVLFKTIDGAKTWEQISPDLTRESYDVPASIGVFAKPEMASMPRRGVIYAVAPSHQKLETIWAGTDDGLIHRTTDGGKTWTNVSPPELTPWSKVSQLDAGWFDNDTCYAAIDRMRLDDWRPHILRTHDGGKTWKEIVAGIPANEVVRAVREDPVRKGLLYCSTERAVYFSIDDGDSWNSLRQNMPATSVRDIVVKDNDLVIGTHGRSFWILDDISPLRQYDPKITAPVLYRPSPAYRVEWNQNTDTPIPIEEPSGKNPPDGAILYYWLPTKPSGPVTLEVFTAERKLVRKYSSADATFQPDESLYQVAPYWFRPEPALSAEAGCHRFVWDQRGERPASERWFWPMTSILRNTPREPRGEWMPPGVYILRLVVDNLVLEQPLELRDPPKS